jgi:hypothetical protein
MEFTENSITCGSRRDISRVPRGKGAWYDQLNAFSSYGPLTARALGALAIVFGFLGFLAGMSRISLPFAWDKLTKSRILPSFAMLIPLS